jgi:hypothetical protein
MKIRSTLLRLILIVAIIAFGLPSNLMVANAATLTTGSVTLSDSRPTTAATSYTIQFSGVSLSLIKCMKVQFSDTATGVVKPAGMVLTSAALSGTSNYVPTPASWGVVNDNVNGTTKMTLAAGETPASATTRTVILTTITNGSTAGTTYYVQFSTYNNIDCATTPVDNATIAFIYTSGQAVTAVIDPTLTFSIAGVANAQAVNGATTTITTTTTTVPLGTLSAGANSIGAHDLIIGTNANSGYTVTVRYTGALTSGAHPITDLAGATNTAPIAFSAAGTEAFGYTTNDALLGTGTAGRFVSNKWAAFTTSPLEVAYNGTAVAQTIRVGYQVGIAPTTQAGSYSTTIVYVAIPTY